MKDQLKVRRKEVNYEWIETSTNVSVKLIDQVFVKHIEGKSQDYVPKEIRQSYDVTMKGSEWTFQHRYVLSEIDHSNLKGWLTSLLEEYVVFLIKYSVLKYEKQIKIITKQMRQAKDAIEIVFGKGEQVNEMTVLSKKRNSEGIEAKLKRLQRFNEQHVIFPMEDFLVKGKILPEQYDSFTKGLVHHYAEIMKSYIYRHLAKFDLKYDLIIKNIKSLEGETKTRIKAGVMFEVVGYEQVFGKFYQFFQRWLQKLNWMILYVQQIECCQREKIGEWLWVTRNIKAVLVSKGSAGGERVAVFAPKKDKGILERDLRTATRIITGKQFPQYRFKLLSKYRVELKKFMASDKSEESNLRVYEQYVLVDCDPHTENKVRKKLREFLEQYNEEEVEITQFKSPFHISIFQKFYSREIKIKPITLSMTNGKLYRLNPKRVSEQAQTEISDIFKLMCKQLIFKPLFKPLPRRYQYFQVTKAPKDWMTIECLQSRRYRLNDKINIYVRSYGSLTNSESDCIFLVHQLGRCEQVKEILKEEGVSDRFEERLNKNRILTMLLRYSKYFQNVTLWTINADTHRSRRNGFATTRLKNDLECLLQSNSNLMHLKIVLPTESQSLIQIFLPHLLEMMLSTYNFNGNQKKEIIFYTSCKGGINIRRELIENLRKFNREGRVERISDLDLRVEDMEKIIQYRYLELKYYENRETKTASPMNSYIFSREILKKGKTPIFLPSDQEIRQLRYNEYLISYFTQEIYMIKEYGIVKYKENYKHFAQLRTLVDLIKSYFQMLDYVVIYGVIEKGVFSLRLFYTEAKESMYRVFEELQVMSSKIMCRNNNVRVQYQLVVNQYLELFRVETHPSKVEELEIVKKSVIL